MSRLRWPRPPLFKCIKVVVANQATGVNLQGEVDSAYIEHVLGGDRGGAPLDSSYGSHVHHVHELRAREAPSGAGHPVEVGVRGHPLVPRMHLEDLDATLQVMRISYRDFSFIYGSAGHLAQSCIALSHSTSWP